jgi:hypothetical protein
MVFALNVHMRRMRKMKRQKIKYINNDPTLGIDYDWKLIKKEFNKLGIPEGVFNPYAYHDVRGGKYIMDLSERNIGKTTNWILIAMIMHELYGTEAVYMREIIDMIMPKNDGELFKTILQCHYIEKITDGQYNNVICKSRRFYYTNTETNVTAVDPFLLKWSLDENAIKKSSVQLPDSDIIIFDEMISRYNYLDEFVTFMDSIISIIRGRACPLIVLLANTIDLHSQWFKEFEIYEDVQHLQPGQHKVITSSEGTIVDIALAGLEGGELSVKRKEQNKRFFGFKNPKLNSIKGGSWAYNVYQHPYREKDTESLLSNRYIEHNGNLLNLEIMYNDKHGIYVVVHKANTLYDDSVIYTLDKQLKDSRYKYKWGVMLPDTKLWKLYQRGLWTYVSNTEGSLIDDYMRNLKML